MSFTDSFDIKSPKVIGAAAIGFLALGLGLYNCMGSEPGDPLTVDQKNDEVLRTAAYRLLAAVKAGGKPTKGSELPPLNAGEQPNPNDAFGKELIIELKPAAGKNMSFTIRSVGVGGQPGTDDDLRAESTIMHQGGPGYDEYLLGIVVISAGK